ncbi:hypothetical protein F5882DRAFT_494656 [Hyaloscypha sp. PMI_1271]|nr:hypothetical protein F5882DRAFT_494656 [Hyaloscypha sp. PMI_1271]
MPSSDNSCSDDEVVDLNELIPKIRSIRNISLKSLPETDEEMNSEGQVQACAAVTTHKGDYSLTPEHCPICHEPFDDEVAVLPCKHIFDIRCIRYWAATKFPRTISCPICRTPITEVLLNVRKEDEKQVPMSEIVRDEDIAAADRDPGDAIFQRIAQSVEIINWQIRQWGRLEARGALSVTYEPLEYLSTVAPLGNGVAQVKRYLSLSIKQQGTRTTSTLHRWLEIKYYKASNTPKFRNLRSRATSLSHPELNRARKEADSFKKEYSENRKLINIGDYENHEEHLEISDRGVQAVTLFKKARGVETSPPLLGTGATKLKIKWTTRLTERRPTRPDDHPQTFPQVEPIDVLQTRGKVRVATEQIRSALAWFRSRNPNDQSTQLDRITTNILEPCSADAAQCDKCPAKHLVGSCLEQWSLVSP